MGFKKEATYNYGNFQYCTRQCYQSSHGGKRYSKIYVQVNLINRLCKQKNIKTISSKTKKQILYIRYISIYSSLILTCKYLPKSFGNPENMFWSNAKGYIQQYLKQNIHRKKDNQTNSLSYRQTIAHRKLHSLCLRERATHI